MADSEEELKGLLKKVKESEKVGSKLNIHKTKIMASGPIISWQIVGKTMETVTDFHFGGSKITPDGDCSVQFSGSVVSDSLQPHELQHARPPCLSPTPGVHPNSSPLSQWCHPTISSSVVPFPSTFNLFLASGSFPVSQFFTSGGQNIAVSASASVLPMICPKVRQLFHLVSQYHGTHFTVVWPIYVRTEAWVTWFCSLAMSLSMWILSSHSHAPCIRNLEP